MVKSTFKNLPDEKRKRIDQALLVEFSHYSLDNAQVARIVKSAQIARGAFYKYFDDLEDAYGYIYHKAIDDIHLGLRPNGEKFDPDLFYQMTVDFVNRTEDSEYRDLIKFHLSENQMEMHHAPDTQSKRLAHLDARTWSAMVLTHEAINLALFDPAHRDQNLKRYKQSLELLKGE